MTDKFKKQHVSVPSTRLKRLIGLGNMTTGIAGNIFLDASSQILRGKKPVMRDLVLTEKNMMRLVEELTKMRGAALKIGQLLSLEAGELLPKPISDILAKARNQSYTMPPKQLRAILAKSWGEDFLSRITTFDVTPIAAASIGQVHKFTTVENKTFVVKVQYPGVKESIDSDIKNMRLLFKTSRLFPPSLDIDSLLDLARQQLYQELDYLNEGKWLFLFSTFLDKNNEFEVPKLISEYSTEKTLAMEFKNGITIDEAVNLNQCTRNKIVYDLIDLIFKEIFEFKTMQTDPNFANFLFDKDKKKIVLLDFGATIGVPDRIVEQFAQLLNAIYKADNSSAYDKLLDLNLINRNLPEELSTSLFNIFLEATAPLKNQKVYDFKSSVLIKQIQDLQGHLFKHRSKIILPELTILLIQRKIGGIFLLARHLKACININKIMAKYV